MSPAMPCKQQFLNLSSKVGASLSRQAARTRRVCARRLEKAPGSEVLALSLPSITYTAGYIELFNFLQEPQRMIFHSFYFVFRFQILSCNSHHGHHHSVQSIDDAVIFYNISYSSVYKLRRPNNLLLIFSHKRVDLVQDVYLNLSALPVLSVLLTHHPSIFSTFSRMLFTLRMTISFSL